MEKKNSIVQKSYELLKNTIPLINKFPRSHKFTLGDRIQNRLADLLELYIQAYYTSLPKKKILLNKANVELEILRHYFRLAYDLGLYNSNRYQDFARQVHEIGLMTGGWLKSLRKS